jgi:hypothetical protein
MEDRVCLEKAAEEVAKTLTFEDYIVEAGFISQMAGRLRQAALEGQLVCYDRFGVYRPKAHESVIFTKPKALNDWFVSIGSPFRYPGGEVSTTGGTTNPQLIEWLNKSPAERGEFTDGMMEGVRVYEIIPPIIPYDDWLNRERITLEEALMLSLGLNPNDPGDKDPLFFPQDEYANRRNQAMQWKKSGLLHTEINREEQDRDHYVKPLEFFRLAMANDWLDPLSAQLDPIIAFLEQNPTKPRTVTATGGADREPTKLEKQQAAIMEAIHGKGFDPLSIPDGEKGTLKMICESDYPYLFDGSTSFDNAWKASKEMFRMANHASYSKRGRT